MRRKLTHFYLKRFNKISDSIKIGRKINFQKFLMHSSIIVILIIATASMAIADESFLIQSFSNKESGENSSLTPRGHIEDFSWKKKVSSEGVIEITGIGFSVVNDDKNKHSFEICSTIQGPLEKFTPSLDSPLACTNTEEIESNEKLTSQTIDFSKGIKVSDLIDISIVIQET